MVKILDASALIVYLWKQPGYKEVQEFLSKATETEKWLLMTTVNFGEVYYLLVRDHGVEEADKILQAIQTLPIEFVPIDLSLTQQAALYKASYKLPFADCFAAALAKLRKGELITTDKDFKVVEEEIKISWLS